MEFNFCSFSSGSSGNCYLVKTENTALLIDAGISGKKIVEGLLQTETPEDQVKGILVTHEHVDHVKSLKTLLKKLPEAKAYANEGTWGCIKEMSPPEKACCFVTGETFDIGDITVRSFATSHDAAEPVGYSLFAGDKKVSIVTDTGCLSEEIMKEVCDADLLVLEANHEEGMVQCCRYPYYIKHRILGDKGHLSNVAAAQGLCRLLAARGREGRRAMQVLLAHLSRENNDPSLAQLSVKNILAEEDFFVGKNVCLDIIVRDTLSAVYQL